MSPLKLVSPKLLSSLIGIVSIVTLLIPLLSSSKLYLSLREFISSSILEEFKFSFISEDIVLAIPSGGFRFFPILFILFISLLLLILVITLIELILFLIVFTKFKLLTLLFFFF